MDYVVVGTGAIGAQLARDGHGVLLCEADAEHVAAIKRLTIKGNNELARPHRHRRVQKRPPRGPRVVPTAAAVGANNT
jgi:hypothetical protein